MYYCYQNYRENEQLYPDFFHKQVIYLYYVAKTNYQEIANLTDYALSTIDIYIRKFKHLLDCAKDLFTKEKPIKEKVTFECEYQELGAYTYIIECYNKKFELEYLKVGMTNNLDRRFYEIGRQSYAKYIKVKKVYSFYDIDAAGAMENILRLVYKDSYEENFVEKDRFKKVHFDKEILDNNLIFRQLEVLKNL